uniref:Uncharacterized protein n=1 Tax=Caenorhabditis japonica TaxID=281687 RepID=A0A8R1I1P4_CAEJA
MRTRDLAHLFVRDHANTVIFEETQTGNTNGADAALDNSTTIRRAARLTIFLTIRADQGQKAGPKSVGSGTVVHAKTDTVANHLAPAAPSHLRAALGVVRFRQPSVCLSVCLSVR